MFAITTKFKGPTDHQGSRIVATCDGRRVVHPYDHALDSEANHLAAARAFIGRHWPNHAINLHGYSRPGVYVSIAERNV